MEQRSLKIEQAKKLVQEMEEEQQEPNKHDNENYESKTKYPNR